MLGVVYCYNFLAYFDRFYVNENICCQASYSEYGAKIETQLVLLGHRASFYQWLLALSS